MIRMRSWLVGSIVAVASLAQFVSSIDPEEARFGVTRCAEAYADALSGAERQKAVAKWTAWNIQNDNPADNTMCLTKCVLERIDLFDPETKKLKVNNINTQFEQYKEYSGVSSEQKNQLTTGFAKIADKTYADCQSLYNDILTVFSDLSLLQAFKKIYLADRNVAAKVYEKLGSTIRVKHQSYFDFCEKKYYGQPEDAKALCRIRNYEINKADKFKEHTECIFKGLRYTDAQNRINATEIQRDFRLANQNGFDQQILECSKQGGALDVYKCLVKDKTSQFFKAFQKAFDFREIRSRDYKLRLTKPDYDATSIGQEVGQIDDAICGTK